MATWTKTEEATLLQEIKTIKTLYEIAKLHNRTPNAIHSRLHRIVSRSTLAGTPCPLDDIRAFLKQKPHGMDFKQTFTREKLQGLAEEQRLQRLTFFIDNYVANGALSSATQGKTSFFYERNEATDPYRGSSQRGPTDEELMEGLKVKFPGSSITLVEEWVDVPARRSREPPTRVLKKGIKIDWS